MGHSSGCSTIFRANRNVWRRCMARAHALPAAHLFNLHARTCASVFASLSVCLRACSDLTCSDYTSNAAFLSPFNAAALVVVRLDRSQDTVRSQLLRWLAKINACGQACNMRFPVVVVGTHAPVGEAVQQEFLAKAQAFSQHHAFRRFVHICGWHALDLLKDNLAAVRACVPLLVRACCPARHRGRARSAHAWPPPPCAQVDAVRSGLRDAGRAVRADPHRRVPVALAAVRTLVQQRPEMLAEQQTFYELVRAVAAPSPLPRAALHAQRALADDAVAAAAVQPPSAQQQQQQQERPQRAAEQPEPPVSVLASVAAENAALPPAPQRDADGSGRAAGAADDADDEEEQDGGEGTALDLLFLLESLGEIICPDSDWCARTAAMPLDARFSRSLWSCARAACAGLC